MKKYNILLNGYKLNNIEAATYDKAFEQAVFLYGLEIDLEELKWN